MLYFKRNQDGSFILEMTNCIVAGYRINKDGTYNKSAKAFADSFNSKIIEHE